MLRLRMVPLQSLFRQLVRIVHDTGLVEEKQVRLLVEGGETDLDKALLEVANDVLGHLVRNAVIHGIESPEERRRAGKDETGTVRIVAYATSREVCIDVEDDGRGVQGGALRAAAASSGQAVDPEADPLDLLLLPGLSTRDHADVVAGRGMGLSAVKETVRRHGGTIQVAFAEGRGSLFRLRLPLSASIARALLVGADGEEYAVPLRAILESLRLDPGALHEINGAGALRWRGRVIAALDLGCVFGTATDRRREGYAIVLEDGRARARVGRRSHPRAAGNRGEGTGPPRRLGARCRRIDHPRRWPGGPDSRSRVAVQHVADSRVGTVSRRRSGSAGSSEDRPEAGGASRARTPVKLPSSGLAHEILAALERGEAAADASPHPPLPPPASSVPSGPTRIYSFADSLERRDSAPSAPVERLESWVTFELAGEVYALPALRIQEIQRAVDITRVPNAPAPVRGIMNLRGKVLVVVDLRQRLGVPSAPIETRSRILVVSSRERSLGLLVDAAQQVIKLPLSRIEAPPPT